jgi:low temperature requirement protein LtrA
LVAGIVLVALGLKTTLSHVDEPLKVVPAVALLGGTALYLLAHVALRYRHLHSLNTRRLGLAALLVAALPLAVETPALATAGALAAGLTLLIAIETHSYGESRERLRSETRQEEGS